MTADAQALREELVASLRALDVVQPGTPLELAFLRVPRHLLLERFWSIDRSDGDALHEHDLRTGGDEALAAAYRDDALLTRRDDERATSSTSQPSLMAHMLAQLELREGMRVLEIGAGTGYNAALLSEVLGGQERVVTVDIDGSVVAQTRRLLAAAGYGGIAVLERDGALGAPEHAPFDRVVATVGCTDVSPAWLEQLAPGGFALVPLEHGGLHPLVRVEPGGSGRSVGRSGFVRVQGSLDRPGFWTLLPPSSQLERASLAGALAEALAGGTEQRRVAAWDLHVFVALSDARCASLLCLVEGGESCRVELDPGELAVSPDGARLAVDLEQHAARWIEAGRPPHDAWRFWLEPLASTAPSDGDLVVRRVHHRQRSWLGER
jgi:protein-L-isoaspartate(D-aspartate) O-methyltransferase